MPSINPQTLATAASGHWTVAPSRSLAGFTQDSRNIRPGDVFIALKTDKRDGHDFLEAALAAGAAAAIVAKPNTALASTLPQLVVADPLAAFQAIAREHRRDFQAAGGTVTAISGSCGKTSTKNLLALLLASAKGASHVLATEGNLNNHIGVPLTLMRLDPTQHTHAIIEAGISLPGEMAMLADMIGPDNGIITMVAPAHTQDLGGVEGVAREKAVLLQHVRAGGTRIFPADCLVYPAFKNLPHSTVITWPEKESGGTGSVRSVNCQQDSFPERTTQRSSLQLSDAVACTLVFSPTSTELSFIGAPKNHRFTFRRVSHGMAQNVALALTLASRLGVTDAQIQSALNGWQPAKWRGELQRDAADRYLYLDFYNANPASMTDALDAFASMVPAELPRLYVLGCMEELGADSPLYHRQLGQSLAKLLRADDQAIVIGERAADIKAGASGDSRISISEAISPIADRVAGFKGAIFVKGSRRYALEKALPPEMLSGGSASSPDKSKAVPPSHPC